jgi:hypothetical protein
MEELTEKRVWQRVRGETDPSEPVRAMLADQGLLLGTYRNLSRRGGAWRRLWEQKEEQVACLRGLLRMLTGQGTARPRCGSAGELTDCFTLEQKFLTELTVLSRDGEWGPLFDALLDRQKCQCRLLLTILGTG